MARAGSARMGRAGSARMGVDPSGRAALRALGTAPPALAGAAALTTVMMACDHQHEHGQQHKRGGQEDAGPESRPAAGVAVSAAPPAPDPETWRDWVPIGISDHGRDRRIGRNARAVARRSWARHRIEGLRGMRRGGGGSGHASAGPGVDDMGTSGHGCQRS